jgi:translation initiation factor 2 alpha subunit (eIF-2alpha)
MFSFRGVTEQTDQSRIDTWKKNQEKIDKLLHQYNAKKVLTPEQEVFLSKIHNMELEFEGSCLDLVNKCSMKKLFRINEVTPPLD